MEIIEEKTKTETKTPKLDAYIASWPLLLPARKAWIGCFAGMRGSGKTCASASMVFTEALARGKKVFSNIPIGATLEYKGETKTFCSEPLDLDLLYSFDERMRDAWVYIDEANYQIEAKRSATTQNLLFADLAQQIRKRRVSMIFTTIFETWLDFRVRQMMDFCARCKDVSYGNWGHEEGIAEGNMFDIDIEDWTGLLTGESYWRGGEPAHWTVMGRATWELVDSYNVQDIWEARKRVKVTFGEHELNIGSNDKADILREKFGDIPIVLDGYANGGVERIPMNELYNRCRVSSQADKREFNNVLRNSGCIIKRVSGGGYACFLPVQEVGIAGVM